MCSMPTHNFQPRTHESYAPFGRWKAHLYAGSGALIADAHLQPLAKSAWPCGKGNLQGNPVYAVQ